MSVSADLWRQIALAKDDLVRPLVRPAPQLNDLATDPTFALVHQLFFPHATLRRRSILFAAADEHSKASRLCERAATTLANFASERVAILHTSSAADCEHLSKKPAASVYGRAPWQTFSSQISDRVWRVPAGLLHRGRSVPADSASDYLRELRSSCKYLLFSAAMGENEIPLFCNLCDAAVLVLTANVTRRETAVVAKEQLLRQGVTLLGVVLDQRTLPIPESIYRRL